MAKKKILSVLITAVMALTFSSCELLDQYNVDNRHTTASLSFSWWGNDVRSSYTIEALEKYGKEHNVEIKPKFSELSGYKKMLDTDIAADMVSDTMQMQYCWLHEYAAQGCEFYDLYLLKDHLHLDNFTDEQLKYGEIDGKLMGIPTSLNSINFFYNADTLKRYGYSEPRTWDELFKLGERLSTEGIYACEMSEKSMWFSAVAYTEQKTGKPMFSKQGRMQYNADEFKVMLEFYKQLINSNVTSRPGDFNHTDFYNNKAAGIACWISEVESYFSSNTGVNASSADITLGIPPHLYSTSDSGWYKRPMALYCVKADTKEPKKSAELVDYLLNSEDMAILQGTEKGVPLSKSAQEVLASRDMLSDLQSVATKRMQEDAAISIMNPFLENDEMRAAFFAAGDEVTFNNADAYVKGRELYENIMRIKVIPK